MRSMRKVLLAVATGLSLSTAHAAPAFWTDWVDTPAPDTVVGNLQVGDETVTVTFEGVYGFVQLSGGTNYWVPSAPYTSAEVDNAPSTPDIIALNAGGEVTVTFSQPVVDPLIALVSWNGNTVDFGTDIEILSFGAGFWGNGTPIVNAGSTGFFGSGEVHGVARILGTQNTIRMSHTSENWHGFTVGVLGLGSSTPLPAPAPLALVGLGLTLLAFLGRRRR